VESLRRRAALLGRCQAGIPQALFNTGMVDTGIRTGPMSWDIAPDGKRFLIITDKSHETSSPNVILNWRPGRAEVTALCGSQTCPSQVFQFTNLDGA
jgi:hypothetical protein